LVPAVDGSHLYRKQAGDGVIADLGGALEGDFDAKLRASCIRIAPPQHNDRRERLTRHWVLGKPEVVAAGDMVATADEGSAAKEEVTSNALVVIGAPQVEKQSGPKIHPFVVEPSAGMGRAGNAPLKHMHRPSILISMAVVAGYRFLQSVQHWPASPCHQL